MKAGLAQHASPPPLAPLWPPHLASSANLSLGCDVILAAQLVAVPPMTVLLLLFRFQCVSQPHDVAKLGLNLRVNMRATLSLFLSRLYWIVLSARLLSCLVASS